MTRPPHSPRPPRTPRRTLPDHTLFEPVEGG
jgi:hypothetical protein